MGVPAFFRWLSIRYPKTVIPALSEDELDYLYVQYEEENQAADPNEINLDQDDQAYFINKKIQAKIKENNPEFDNLYLDMNGIIHPCTRASGPG